MGSQNWILVSLGHFKLFFSANKEQYLGIGLSLDCDLNFYLHLLSLLYQMQLSIGLLVPSNIVILILGLQINKKDHFKKLKIILTHSGYKAVVS